MAKLTLYYHQSGDTRLSFVRAVTDILGVKPKYTGVPKCAYIIDFATVNREGNIEVDERTDSSKLTRLMQKLMERGYMTEQSGAGREVPVPEAAADEPGQSVPDLVVDGSVPEPALEPAVDASATEPVCEAAGDSSAPEPAADTPATDEPEQTEEAPAPVGTTISVPRDIFTDIGLENLKKILWAKGELIRQALDISSTDIEVTEETVSFPWFGELDAEEIRHISQFISGLCEFANTSKRITSKQRHEGNPKFAMRTWAIRLGFNGAEYKGLRAYLMKRLPGDAAWRFGKPENDLPTEPRLPISVQATA